MDYFESYMEYAGLGVSEPPAIFHRWVAVTIIGTLLGRQTWFPFGHSAIYPNQYVMLMGHPGSRKSSAINIGVKLLKAAGYNRFASDKTSKEKFLMDMMQYDEGDLDDIERLENLTLDEPAEVLIAAEEFTDFVGHNNIEFLTMLTKLWDNQEEYKHPKIHGQSVVVVKPTVNILSGNTAQGFALAFPPEALGNGFLSRMILVHGEPTGRKITFPPPPDYLLKDRLSSHLKEIQRVCIGATTLDTEARKLCEIIYPQAPQLDDPRFRSYNTRRFTHLLKLAIIMAATELRTEINADDILKANTLLYITEIAMPKALGEFGKGKHTETSQKILDLLSDAKRPVKPQAIWKQVANDLSKYTDLSEILRNLEQAEKIQVAKDPITGAGGYVLRQNIAYEWSEEYLNLDWLSLEEVP